MGTAQSFIFYKRDHRNEIIISVVGFPRLDLCVANF